MKTRAAILVAQRRPLELAEIELPSKLERGQVLVRVLYSGLCGSQLGEIDGVKGPDPYLPHLLGHEGSGVVEGIGPGVRHVKKGDEVVLHWRPGAGIEAATPRYRWGARRINAGRVTTFNERTIVSENRLTKVPKGVPLELAWLFGCAVTTGFGIVENNAKLQRGQSLLVFGVGGVGLSVVQAAALAGAKPIVGLDLHKPKLELARKLGSTYVFDARSADLRRKLARIFPRGADVVVECTGRVQVIEQAYELTAPQGRTVLVGVPPVGQKASLYTLPLHFGKVLTGSHGGEARPAEDIPRQAALSRSGRLKLEPLVTDRFQLDQINEAIAAVRSGRVAGRAVIEMIP
jgi:S-(hydroxymethyl)glutathione dehydrogenase/alcohol dehydrogenase